MLGVFFPPRNNTKMGIEKPQKPFEKPLKTNGTAV